MYFFEPVKSQKHTEYMPQKLSKKHANCKISFRINKFNKKKQKKTKQKNNANNAKSGSRKAY